MKSKNITFDQCKQKYLQNKELIDKFIIQTIFFQFSSQNIKYITYLTRVINIIEQLPEYQQDLNIQNDSLLDLLSKQYSVIKQCKDMFINYLKNKEKQNEKHINEIKFYYFKVTYFLSLENQQEDIYEQYLLLSKTNRNIIFNIISPIEQLRKDYNDLQLIDEEIKQKSYENVLHLQKFYKVLRKSKKEFESYKVNEKEDILMSIKTSFSEEEQFFKDVFDGLEIIGENLKILKNKQDKENLFLYSEYSFYRNEFFVDLVDKYSLQQQFQFFDKFKFLNFLADPDYIQCLSQDETVLCFYIFSFLSLIKFNYLSSNVEQNLCMLVQRLSSFEQQKQNAGIIFTMKIIKDLKEKDCLDEDIYTLFNEWNNQPDYKVNHAWINREFIQLLIDQAQSAIKVAVIPEIARFFFKHNQLIPFQISNHEYSLSQHIIIGKQFHLRHPDQLIDQLKFWKELNSQIIQVIELLVDGKTDSGYSGRTISQKICQININMCELLLQEKEQKKDMLLNELDNYIDQFIKLINYHLYENIYLKKQLFYTLQSLLIKDDIVIPIIIKKLKNQKEFHETKSYSQNVGFLLLSFKNNFDIRNYIYVNQDKNYDTLRIGEEFELLFERFKIARNSLKERKIKIDQILQQFKDIISEFEFLNQPQYQVFKLNIEIYIKQIELEIELDQKPSITTKIKTKFIKTIQVKSQFLIDIVELNGLKIVRKSMNKNLNNQQLSREKKAGKIQSQKQQIINEFSILNKLKYHKNVIKIIDYNISNGEIQLYLEYCDKDSLFIYLKNNKLTKEQKINICIDILEGVKHLHENNILHGDLKLGNIVVDSNDIIKIIDFGSCAFLVEECQFFTPGYQSDDTKQSLFKDYFSIGIILFSVLLQDNLLPKNYKEYKNQYGKIQNKKILKEYFKIDKPNQPTYKEMIENEYSPLLFKAILSLFNEQPYLRPKLSQLIDTFKNHKITLNNINQNKYSVKKAIINLEDQYNNSQLVQLIIKTFFQQQTEQDLINKRYKVNQKDKNNEDNVKGKHEYSSTQGININQEKDITIKKNERNQQTRISQNKQNEEEKIEDLLNKKYQLNQQSDSKENRGINEQLCSQNQDLFDDFQENTTINKNKRKQYIEMNQNKHQNENESQQIKKHSEQNKTIKKQINDQNNEIENKEIKQNDLNQNLIEYFINKIDKKMIYQFKPFENIKNKKLNLRNLEIDFQGLLMNEPRDRAKHLIKNICCKMDKHNIDDFLIIAELVENQKIKKIITSLKFIRQKISASLCINMIKFILKISLLVLKRK